MQAGDERYLLDSPFLAMPAGYGYLRYAASTMTEPKTYPLRLSIFTKILFPAILGMGIFIGGPTLVGAAVSGDAAVIPFAIFWFGILGFFAFQALSLPQSIVLHSDDRLEFRAPMRTRTVLISDLTSVKPIPNQFGFFKFRSTGRSVTVLMQFDGFHELAAILKAKNPRISLLGC